MSGFRAPVSRTGRTLLLVLFCTAVGIKATAQGASPDDLPAYDMTVRLVPDERRIEVRGEVTVPAAARTTDPLRVRLDERFADLDMAVVAPRGSAGPVTVSQSGNITTVNLPGTLPRDAPLVLRFAYQVSSAWARSFYTGPDGAFISGESYNWYPMPVGGRRATGRLRFEAPAGFSVAATGHLEPGLVSEAGVSTFRVTDATTFSFVAGRHHVYRSEGSPAIALYLLRERPRVAERLERLRTIVTALEAEFGPFPHPDLAIVEMPAAAAGDTHAGVSLDGFVVAGEAQADSFNFAFLAHEIGHQWWADCLFPTGRSRGLLTEAMAQYGSLRAVEAVHGSRAASEFRWAGYPGYGIFDNGRGYLNLFITGLDAPLVSGSGPQQLSYSKGFLVHDLLARTMGRDRFREFLRGFISTHRFQDVTWEQFVEALPDAAGLKWFIEQWYERPGLPDWTLTWAQQDGRLDGTVTQASSAYRADVDVLVEGSGRSLRRRVRIDGPRTQFEWPVDFVVASVRLDPDYEVPHVTAERRSEAEVIAPVAAALKLMREAGSGFLNAVREVYSALPDKEAPNRRFMLETIEYDEAYRRGDTGTASIHLERALASPFRVASLLPEMYFVRAVLARASGNRGLMEESADAAAAADSALAAPSGWGAAAQDLLAGP